jgi:hypothetical protein
MDMQSAQLTSAGWIILGVGVGVGVGVVIAAAGFVWALLPPGETRMARWLSHHGLTLTESNRAVIAGYLRRTRALQVAGAGPGGRAPRCISASSGGRFRSATVG